MSEIDWSKAPADATHYSPPIGVFIGLWAKQIDGVWHYHRNDFEGWYHGAQPMSNENYIARPGTQWSGDGLPPVGFRCEAKFTTDWVPFELLYLGTSFVVFKTSFEVSRPRLDFEQSGVEFRPIRTEAQIAAEERNAFISEIAALLGWDERFDGTQREAGKLYDAGYRKQEPKP